MFTIVLSAINKTPNKIEISTILNAAHEMHNKL